MKQFCYIMFLLPLLACEGNSSADSSAPMSDGAGASGQGGSMARFALQGDYLYTVDQSMLKVFDLSTPSDPRYLSGKDQALTFGVETIFPMDTLLFIGSQTGMYIYNIARQEFPQQIAYVSHITSCDPVVASGQYAYVTLNSENSWCGRSANELRIYDLSNIDSPQLIRTETGFMHPKGLGIDGDKLFICDNGLKVYDVSDPEKPRWIDDLSHIPEADGINSYDVIPLGGVLLLIGNDGFYQFDYTGERLSLISKISVTQVNK